MYQIIASGSSGNCIIYHNSIAVDMGINYKAIEGHKNSLQLVLLTHVHQDHLNMATIAKLAFERPSLRFACGEFLGQNLIGIKNVDILEAGKVYDYGSFSVSPVRLYHDCPNFGYRIFKNGTKLIHMTDTAHIEGIEAKNYDLYCIEFNYNEETVNEQIAAAKARGEFCHRIGAVNSHLSEQQARDFIFKNAGPQSKILMLHESKTV